MLSIRKPALTALAVLLIVTVAASPFSSSLKKPIHSVTGSGAAEEEGVRFTTTIAAHQAEDGDVWGTIVVNLDLSAFNVEPLITFRQVVTCVDVDGNSAWIGGVVTQSNNQEIIPIGQTTVTLVRDLGSGGQDIMHGEPSAPEVTCLDRPAFNETVVTHGNYTVR